MLGSNVSTAPPWMLCVACPSPHLFPRTSRSGGVTITTAASYWDFLSPVSRRGTGRCAATGEDSRSQLSRVFNGVTLLRLFVVSCIPYTVTEWLLLPAEWWWWSWRQVFLCILSQNPSMYHWAHMKKSTAHHQPLGPMWLRPSLGKLFICLLSLRGIYKTSGYF